ncbi:MAG: DNA-binding response OmpR family regulator [Bacteriovoracaceae bacterium]|jgi:DNA-binding response OmpR family regulator
MKNGLLFIEDEEEIRELIIERLQDDGFKGEIFEASDPVKGLDLFHNHKDQIGFVICDYYLPIQNGNDLCKMIKENSSDVKIICLTGDTTVSLENHKGEVDLVLYKPEGIDELSELLKE